MSGAKPAVDAAVDLGGIRLRNPVLTASGTFGYGTEFAPFLDLRRIGGFVAKSLTLKPRVGNPPPRIAEAPSGMLNAISLENVGVFVDEGPWNSLFVWVAETPERPILRISGKTRFARVNLVLVKRRVNKVPDSGS